MSMENNRVLAHDLCRELTVYELEAVAGGLAPTGTTIGGGGSTPCHDSDDSTTGNSSACT